MGIEPVQITFDHFDRAAHLVEVYVLPMARRAYANGAMPKEERAARKLARLLQEEGWRTFSTQDVLRLERAGLSTKAELDPALILLEDAAIVRSVPDAPRPQGGRPKRLFSVNPGLWGEP